MSSGTFMALYGALCVTLAIMVPLPVGPPRRDGGIVPVGAPPRCLRLEFPPAAGPQHALPSVVRLRSDGDEHDEWLLADGAPGPGLHVYARWRPAGPDSLDLTWHHAPVIRLSARGPHLAGRALYSGALPLLWLIAEPIDYRVEATEIACPREGWAPR